MTDRLIRRCLTPIRGLAAAAVAFTLLASPSANALNIFVDQNASWQYINATSATTQSVDSNWFAYNYDDSGWFTGPAPFSSGATSGTFGGDFGNVNGPYDPGTAPGIPTAFTQWDTNFDPYARVEFELTEQTDLTIWMAVDNGIESMYLNGVEATAATNAEGAAFRWEHVFDISSEFTVAGRNVLALQLEDHGGETAFTLVVSGDDEAENPVFTTNPAVQISEPGMVAILGFALAGLGISRRRARR